MGPPDPSPKKLPQGTPDQPKRRSWVGVRRKLTFAPTRLHPGQNWAKLFVTASATAGVIHKEVHHADKRNLGPGQSVADGRLAAPCIPTQKPLGSESNATHVFQAPLNFELRRRHLKNFRAPIHIEHVVGPLQPMRISLAVVTHATKTIATWPRNSVGNPANRPAAALQCHTLLIVIDVGTLHGGKRGPAEVLGQVTARSRKEDPRATRRRRAEAPSAWRDNGVLLVRLERSNQACLRRLRIFTSDYFHLEDSPFLFCITVQIYTSVHISSQSALPRSRLRQRRANGMYEHAIEQFQRHGYEATTVDMIADAAGVSRRTFFNYFASKEHVLAVLHRQVTLAALDELQRHAESPATSVRLALTTFATSLEGKQKLAGAMLRALFSSEVLKQQDQADVSAFIPTLVKRIQASQATFELANHFDAAEIANHLMAVTTGAITHWAMRTDARPGELTTLLDQRLTMAFEGLKAPT